MVPPSAERDHATTVNRKASTIDLSEESVPGVPLLGTRVGWEGKITDYDSELLNLLYSIADYLDTPTEDGRTRLEELVPRVFSDEKFTYEKVIEQQERFIAALKALATEPQGDKRIVFALPIYGALPIADQLKETFPDRLFPIDISGSSGTTTGTAKVHGELPDELLDKNNIVIFADDVADSCITAAQLAMKRRERRLNIKKEDYEKDKYAKLIKSIQDLREKREDLREQKKDATPEFFAQLDESIEEINKQLVELYPLLTPLFQEEGVVIATLYSKNEPVFTTLKGLAKDSTTQWESTQKGFINVCEEINEDDWIVGGRGNWRYPLLDTKINGSDILEKIPENYRELLGVMGLGKLSLRIGAGIKSLKIFNPAAKEALLQTITNLIVEHLKEYLNPSN